jgi:cathepsin L
MDGTCKFNASNVGATIKSWTDVPTGSEADLQKAVATVGPVSVAIDASQYTFQLYKSGGASGQSGQCSAVQCSAVEQ